MSKINKPLALVLGVTTALASTMFAVTYDKQRANEKLGVAEVEIPDRGQTLPEPEEIKVTEKVEITLEPIELPTESTQEIDVGEQKPLPLPPERFTKTSKSAKKAVDHKPIKLVAEAPRPKPRKTHYKAPKKPKYQSWGSMMEDRYRGATNYEGYKARFNRTN